MFRRIRMLVGVALAAFLCGGDARASTEPDSSTDAAREGARISKLRSALGTTAGEGKAQVWGSLSGRFVYAGSAPEGAYSKTEANAGDLLGTHETPDESLVIDRTTNGIKNIVVYARKVSRVHESYAQAADHSVVLAQERRRYTPHVVALQVGQTLKIRNHDPIVHIGVIEPFFNSGTNVLLQPGSEADRRFAFREPLPVPVSCGSHPWMKAYVLPLKHPYVAASDDYGSFHIADLPAGEEIEFQVWHEKARGRSGVLTAKTEWTDGRFRVTIPSGKSGVRLGTIEVAPNAFWTTKPWYADR